MQKYNKINFVEEISMSNSQSSGWLSMLNSFLPLALILFLIPSLGCSTKPKVEQVVIPYFIINGIPLDTNIVEIPDSTNSNVYSAEVNVVVRFEGPEALSPEVNQWIIDGKVIESGKNQFAYTFELPGLYQVKHCHGTDNCATRFVYVKEPAIIQDSPANGDVIQSPTPKETASPRNQIREEDKRQIQPPSKPKDPSTKPSTPIEPIKPPEPSKPESKRASNPPEVYKSSMITGLPSSTYKSDCASWVESASIKLTIKDWCELHSATVYGNGSGKLKIQLTNGDKFNEAMIVTLNPGKTNFSFAGLDAGLQPDVEYTLRITTLGDGKLEKPKIGNIAKCGSGSGNTSSILSIDYGSDLVLFDLKYKY